ncbi:hypothetical protein [Neobacillus sp. D3-1R]|uniref:hypothetical protein n=1 Tax=Neobacillus sp. D3-1R TaxID=3445778 RepID=UPI003FA0DA8B
MRFGIVLTIMSVLFGLFGGVEQASAAGVSIKKEFEYKTPYLTHSQLKEILHITSDGSVLVALGSMYDTLSGFKLISSTGKLKWQYKTKELLKYGYQFGYYSEDAFYLMPNSKEIEIIGMKDGKVKKKIKVTDKEVQNLSPLFYDQTNTVYYVSNDYEKMLSINLTTKEKKWMTGQEELDKLIQMEKHFNLDGVVPNEAYSYLDPHMDDQGQINPKDYRERAKKYNGYWSMTSGHFFYEPKTLYYLQNDKIVSKSGLQYSDSTLFAFSSNGKKLIEVNKLGHADDLFVENGISYMGTAVLNPKNIEDYKAYLIIIDKNGKTILKNPIPDRIFSIVKVKNRILLNLVNGKLVSYKIQ